MPVPVKVNLDVLIDASGEVSIFGQQAPTILNKVVATGKLPVRALYDASGLSNGGVLNSLFEFWEPTDALGDIKGALSSGSESEGRDYTKMLKKLVMDLQSVLTAEFDVSGATPFSAYDSSYHTVPHFGRLALNSYAHYILGHIASSAIITNDTTFMGNMMSTNDVSGNTAGTYRYASTDAVDLTDLVSSASDAKLAVRLVDTITKKDTTALTAIVKQVLGQDASRARDQDNNAIAPGVRQELKFIAGDKIYLNIRLATPTISAQQYQLNAPTTSGFANAGAEVNYTLEIELDDSVGADWPAAAPAPSGNYPITINSVYMSSTDPIINFTSTESFNKDYIKVIEIINNIPNFSTIYTINTMNIINGVTTFDVFDIISGNTYDARLGISHTNVSGKEYAIYALPTDRYSWDSYATYGYRISNSIIFP
jgi:hypothetical protein